MNSLLMLVVLSQTTDARYSSDQSPTRIELPSVRAASSAIPKLVNPSRPRIAGRFEVGSQQSVPASSPGVVPTEPNPRPTPRFVKPPIRQSVNPPVANEQPKMITVDKANGSRMLTGVVCTFAGIVAIAITISVWSDWYQRDVGGLTERVGTLERENERLRDIIVRASRPQFSE